MPRRSTVAAVLFAAFVLLLSSRWQADFVAVDASGGDVGQAASGDVVLRTAAPSAAPQHDASAPDSKPTAVQATAAGGRATTPGSRTDDESGDAAAQAKATADCLAPVAPFPLAPLEREIDRIYRVTEAVMRDLNATYWPTDGTLLGMMRNGRVATDRDIDLQIHATYATCRSLLASLGPAFEKHVGKLKSFKVVTAKHPKTRAKIGRYAMVRMFRKHGTFDTGADFNCVFTDEPSQFRFYVHRGTLEPVPMTVYPLGTCLLYGRSVPCPADGYAVLDALKPRYAGCMVFPHCVGDPTVSAKACLSPHPPYPMQQFVDWTMALQRCGHTSLGPHYRAEPACARMMAAPHRCDNATAAATCFLQAFKG